MNFGEGLDFKIWENKGLHPLVNFNFTLQVEGIYNLPCKSVRVFQRENEYDYYQEGGLNDYVHLLRKPISKPLTFQVERYVGVDMFDPLALGTDLILPVLLSVSRYQGEGAAGGWEQPQRIYTFTGCTVMSKEFGELNAEQSGLLVETTTISYREMVCLDNPSTGMTKGTWSFQNATKETGTPKTKYARVPDQMLNKTEMKAKASIYEDSKATNQSEHLKNYTGTKVPMKVDAASGTVSGGIAKKNAMKTRAAMEKTAKRYVDSAVTTQPDYIQKYAGEKVSTTKDAAGNEMIGIAKKNKMTPKAEVEKSARRYVDPAVTTQPDYIQKYAGEKVATTKDAAGNETIGIAKKNKMTPKKTLESQAVRYQFKKPSDTTKRRAVTQETLYGVTADKKADMQKKAQRYVDGALSTQPEHIKNYTGKKISTSTDANGNSMVGIAKKYTMTPKAAMALKAVRYQFKNPSDTANRRAVTQESLYGVTTAKKDDMQKKAQRYVDGALSTQPEHIKNYAGKKVSTSTDANGNSMVGIAKKNPMTSKSAMEKKATRYYFDKSKSKGKYAGTAGKRAETQDKLTGTAAIGKAQMEKNATRYFVGNNGAKKNFKGTAKRSAVTNTEPKKSDMQALARSRQWPPHRSAAQVATFLKKK